MDFSGDRTVVIPTPGGQPGFSEPATDPHDRAPGQWSTLFDDCDGKVSSGFNRLENAAFKLLSLIPTIRRSHSNPSAGLLRQQMSEEIEQYENNARQSGVEIRTVMMGRYILCTVLDEVVLNTPWGGQSDWQTRSLLSIFHNETWGGENFFIMLTRLEKDPGANVDLLELMYICLTLGFEGRYALEADRMGKLAEIRSRLYRVIRTQRGETIRQLSPHWQGVASANRNLRRFVPLWAFTAVMAGLLALLFFTLLYLLNQISTPVFRDAANLAESVSTSFERQRVVDLSALQKLRIFLKPEIDENLVAVEERDNRVRIILRGDLFFRSAQAGIIASYEPLLKRIAQALYEVEGKVLVEGHSDSQPISTFKYPSNWHLSLARAEEVADHLAAYTRESERFEVEAKADTVPVADNGSAEGRAKNRRVEIVLLSNVVWRTGEGE
ncbi:type IVB secretion system protein IcmH/DotU [Marinobacterium stanieri]|uniref:type IVB secretion system protein IcmH/DotU n=1 Tax=Marinobacterium stanieri TaxID=49186 RepID=UPI000255A93D|nr:type IVB secretion system protein IcmH/DotU [Marinobacterium stanieri]